MVENTRVPRYKQDVLDFSKDGKMVYYFIKDDEIKDFFS